MAPKNNATPVTRCRIDVMAGSGCLIVRKSRFTGLFLFTALVHTRVCPVAGQRVTGSARRLSTSVKRPLSLEYLTGVNFKYGGYESHKSHIDIQYAIKGLEKIRVSTQDINSIIYQKPIEDDRYITKFKKPDNEIIIGKGVFAIMFPSDLHAPQLSVDKSELIEKITIKIEINESDYPFTRKRWK